MADISLYIHIPFCKSRCKYCDFISSEGLDQLIPGYIKALTSEIGYYEDVLRHNNIRTVFIGGGTPSYIDPDYITAIMGNIRNLSSMADIDNAEITIEANPGTLSEKKLLIYRLSGINRISIGLQSMDEGVLNTLGRRHSAEDFMKAVTMAVQNGFDNINADLIFGVPGQTKSSWEHTLIKTIKSGVTHVSCYSLKIEDGTKLGKMVEEGSLKDVSDEEDREMYYMAKELLAKNGFAQYEISNFAREGYMCRHNIVYWKAESYIGLGAGAHSFYDGIRYSNTGDILKYVNNPSNIEAISEESTAIGLREAISEFIILGLRMIAGICPKEIRGKFGVDLFDMYGKKIEMLESLGLLERSTGRIKLTSKGLDLANKVMVEFLD